MSGNWDWSKKDWWDHDGKHDPSPRDDWPTIRAGTEYGDAMYHPVVIRAGLQEQIELDTVAPENEVKTNKKGVRIFVREVTGLPGGVPLGASKGHETNWCYVEWKDEPKGTVHGRPMDEQRVRELKNKAKKL